VKNQSKSRPKQALLVCFLVFAAACDTPKQPVTVKDTAIAVPEWAAEFDEMVSVLALTADEQSLLRTAFEERNAILQEWLEGDEGKALREEEKALHDAVESRNLAAVQAVTRKESTQREKFRSLVEQTELEVLAAIPPDKIPDWEGHRITKRMLERMAPLGLSDEQAAAIRSNGRTAVEQARSGGESNPLSAGYLELERWAETNVLSTAQREAYVDIKKKSPLASLRF
jgi:hypothetical protein